MFKLIMFIELCKISKLVMHLNPCSMDFGRDKLRQRDQIGDGFERHDQTGGAEGQGLDLGFTSDNSLRPSAWAWYE